MRTSFHFRSLLRGSLPLAALALLSCGSGPEPGSPLDETAAASRVDGRHHGGSCDDHGRSRRDWRERAALPEARSMHCAVRLPSGQVLVAGGLGQFPAPLPTSIVIYDPVTDRWTTRGSLPAAEPRMRAVVLPDGRVLLSPGGALLDPLTGSSTAVPLTPGEAMRGYPFSGSTLTLLRDGKVLRTGGDDESTYLKEAVLYDPATNSWSTAGAMSVSRSLHTATLLADGRVLVVGGYTLTSSTQRPAGRTSVEIYDPRTGTFTEGPPVNVPRMQHTATRLPSGRVLVLGGGGRLWDSDSEEAQVLVEARYTAEIYDPVRNTWTLTPPPRLSYGAGHTATLTHAGVLAIDGEGAEIFSEAHSRWSAAPAPTPRRFHTATALRDGSVLLTGGTDATAFSNAPTLTSVERLGCF